MSTLTLTSDNFAEIVNRNAIVLVDWWAGWCGPCRQFAPVYEASSNEHPEIVYGKVDTEAEPELTAMAQVDRFPTLMAFREGIIVFSQPGFLHAAALEEVVQHIRWLDMDAVRAAAEQSDSGARDSVPAHIDAATAAVPAARVLAGPATGPVTYGWPGL
ncbi:thioredoxin family protein [Nocardia bovistercoris]|uniref:Thioredoxin family protein n=1 Tax=Nocardia bovistercoris TaxID=2785916 RepID=A0A931IA00_9NOCA|nr:thioredoxin family protein [Nocardia bovistercoris]